MKAKLLLLAALIPATMSATEPANDTTIVVNNKKLVIKNSDGTTKVQVYDINGDEEQKTFEGHYSDGQDIEQVYVTSPFIPEKKHYRNNSFKAYYPAIFFGFNELPNSIASTNSNPYLHSRESKSWEWGLTFASFCLPFNNSNTFGITSAIQLTNIHNHFADNYIMKTDLNGNTYMEQSENNLKKSYISYWAWRIPVMLEWQRKYGSHKLYAAFGPSLEFRRTEHSRYFIGNRKYTETSDININPIGINAQFQVGYGDIMLYVRSALTPLLNKNNAPECYPTAIGFGIKL